LFLLAHLGFVGANVFYDAFLPDLTTDDTIDMVSSRGFAWGYIGGGIHLLLALILIQGSDAGLIPLDPILATRIALGSVGIWWLAFSVKALREMPETGQSSVLPGQPHPRWTEYVRIGFSRTIKTTGRVVRNRPLLVFVVAFILFNDGVQTTIALASVYATETLELGITIVIVAVLLVQFVAFFGAMAFGRYSTRVGTKRALFTSIMVWALVSVAAFFLPVGAGWHPGPVPKSLRVDDSRGAVSRVLWLLLGLLQVQRDLGPLDLRARPPDNRLGALGDSLHRPLLHRRRPPVQDRRHRAGAEQSRFASGDGPDRVAWTHVR
jgi:MFS-type transporter involved in bile tolerance (Atg22 family)